MSVKDDIYNQITKISEETNRILSTELQKQSKFSESLKS